MTNPTDPSNGPRLRLTLDDGELLEVDGSTIDDSGVPAIVLRLTPWRAHDLAHVLDTYTRVVEVMSRSSEVSGTEASLSRALFDAVSVLRPATGPESPPLGKVTSGRRALAMAVLQEHRPDLDHTALIAVVDAAAMWTDADEDYLVMSLLSAVGGEEAARPAYVALTGSTSGAGGASSLRVCPRSCRSFGRLVPVKPGACATAQQCRVVSGLAGVSRIYGGVSRA